MAMSGYWGPNITGQLLASQRWAGPDKLIGGVLEIVAAAKIDAARRKARKQGIALDEELESEMAVSGGPLFGRKRGGQSIFEELARPGSSIGPATEAYVSMSGPRQAALEMQQYQQAEKLKEIIAGENRRFGQQEKLYGMVEDRQLKVLQERDRLEQAAKDEENRVISEAVRGRDVPPPLLSGLPDAPSAKLEFQTPDAEKLPESFGKPTDVERAQRGVFSLLNQGNITAASKLAGIAGILQRPEIAREGMASRERIAETRAYADQDPVTREAGTFMWGRIAEGLSRDKALVETMTKFDLSQEGREFLRKNAMYSGGTTKDPVTRVRQTQALVETAMGEPTYMEQTAEGAKKRTERMNRMVLAFLQSSDDQEAIDLFTKGMKSTPSAKPRGLPELSPAPAETGTNQTGQVITPMPGVTVRIIK